MKNSRGWIKSILFFYIYIFIIVIKLKDILTEAKLYPFKIQDILERFLKFDNHTILIFDTETTATDANKAYGQVTQIAAMAVDGSSFEVLGKYNEKAKLTKDASDAISNNTFELMKQLALLDTTTDIDINTTNGQIYIVSVIVGKKSVRKIRVAANDETLAIEKAKLKLLSSNIRNVLFGSNKELKPNVKFKVTKESRTEYTSEVQAILRKAKNVSEREVLTKFLRDFERKSKEEKQRLRTGKFIERGFDEKDSSKEISDHPVKYALLLNKYEEGVPINQRVDEKQMLLNFEKFCNQYQNLIMIAHNAEFDMKFINARRQHYGLKKIQGIKVIDTLEVSRMVVIPALRATETNPDSAKILEKMLSEKGYSSRLGDIAKAFGIDAKNAHDAFKDVQMLFGILQNFINFLKKNVNTDLTRFQNQAILKYHGKQ